MATTMNAKDGSPNVANEKMERLMKIIIQKDVQVLFFKVITGETMTFVSMELLTKHHFGIQTHQKLDKLKIFKHG